jgi:hypothetical protein
MTHLGHSLGCVVMYLPQSAIERFKGEPAILNKTITLPLNGWVGETHLTDTQSGKALDARVYKKTNQSGFEQFYIVVKNIPVGQIVLNRYTNKNGAYASQFGPYHKDSPFAVYGNGKEQQLFADKVFVEFDCSRPKPPRLNVKLDETEIKKKLYQIAVEWSDKTGGEGRIQCEADLAWGELPNSLGFLVQDCEHPKTTREIETFISAELIQAETEKRPPNWHMIGSVPMILSRQQADARQKQIPILFTSSKTH